jgi:methyl-accepting chemotaxis protein
MTTSFARSPIVAPSRAPGHSTGTGAGPDLHGILAPGARLLLSLQFPSKALLVSATFLVPIALLAVSLWSSTQETISFAEQERTGVVALRAVVPVYEGMLQARVAARAARGGFDSAKDFDQAREKTDKAIAALGESLKASGDPIGLAPGVAKLQGAWRAAVQAPNVSGADDADAFEPTTAAALALVSRIGDDSKLVLDPDLDSFYLMSALVLALPRAIEDLGQVSGWGVYSLARSALDAKNAKQYSVWSASSQVKLSEARNYVERVLNATPTLKNKLGTAPMDSALAFGKDAIAQVEVAHGDAAKLYASAAAATHGLFAFYDGGLDALDELLAARMAAAQQSRMIRFAMVLACLIAAAYLFTAFYKVTETGLSDVAHHLDAMAGGDLTTHPEPRGKDEMAALMRSLKAMQSSVRAIVSSVRSSSESIVHASGEISSASTDLSARTESAAANLEQSAASMEEISSTVKQTAESVRRASSVASDNSKVAARGGAVIAEVVSTMQDINVSSQKIGDIIGTIDGIAFQTNILALNAAVEAARAGEQGRGFAVVASEVRSLAQRSAEAAREIKALITSSVEKVESGARVVKGAGDTMEELVGNARRMNELLAEIATAASEQSSGVVQVDTAVHQLDQMTQQNAALVEETAAAASALNDQAQGLATEVARFKL